MFVNLFTEFEDMPHELLDTFDYILVLVFPCQRVSYDNLMFLIFNILLLATVLFVFLLNN